MNNSNNYKTHITGIILSAYLFFFITNIFHYHTIVFSPESQIKNEKETSTNSTDLNFLNLNTTCQFQSTFLSIQTIDKLNSFIFPPNKNSQKLSPDTKHSKPNQNKLPENNPLRAPPSGK